MAGGIRRLLGLIRHHRGALEYDFRRLGFTLSDVGNGVSILEAARLAALLVRDQASWTSASCNGWDHPWSIETELMAELVDMLGHVLYEQPVPVPRPWSATPTESTAPAKRQGDQAASLTREEALEVLRRNAGR